MIVLPPPIGKENKVLFCHLVLNLRNFNGMPCRALLGWPASLGTMDDKILVLENHKGSHCDWVLALMRVKCAALEVT